MRSGSRLPAAKWWFFPGFRAAGISCWACAIPGTEIASDDQLRVFQSFGQGRHDIVSGERGTGLGLTIVKGLSQAHGGRVDLASARARESP
ncbi:MAG TPA: sensor histidine kinase [Rhizomicrobium sp.]|jgi:K+-sensing histidine kinase KdpD|nr:sensor histidine kinase [Rhizomicrobium sp.]